MQVKTQTEELQNYLSDASNMPGGHGERLFVPETEDDIAAILRDANEAGVAVTIAGARTGNVGGAVPLGGWVVSLERLNKVKSIDKEAMTAVVEPGVILADIQKAVEAEGLYYPPDPTEWSCQIGGNVATNASGARSFKYGATRNFVKALSVVLADGEMLKLRRDEIFSNADGTVEIPTVSDKKITARIPTYKRPNVRKNVSGYYNEQPLDAIDVFIGSEGTLGVITEIELRLVPKPEGLFAGIVFFADHGDLLAFVDEARQSSFQARLQPPATAGGSDVNATLLEYFDDRSLEFIREKFPETPDNVAGAIFFEQETTSETEDALFEAWNALLEKHNADVDRSWFTTTDQDREKMREFRHALPVAVNERLVRTGQKKVSSDMAVPDESFAGFLKFQKEMMADSGIDHIIFGHIGDCHLHANLLPKTDEEALRARHIYGRFIAQAIMIGGCVSAEHGIGKMKSKYLYVMMGERYLNEMAELKRAFDPKGILGRGNMFDEKFI
ncbi:MAG: FAD-binding oxidoreductase [Acidobacteriota bacterium]|nr:MAG: FAD-binding oxidoreductase [Acidobacteriota bacterium]